MPYDFTRSVQDPRDLYPQGYGATQDSTAAAIGTALSGAATIFDMGIKAMKEHKTNEGLAAFENEIAPYVQAVGQGRMDSNDAMTRTTAKIKTYIDRYPQLADDLRKRAQSIWGVDPGQQLVQHAQDAEIVKRKRQQDVDNYNLGVANQFGAIPLDEKTGQPDYQAGIEVGRELAQYTANIKAATEEANLEIARRKLNGEGEDSLEDRRKKFEVRVGTDTRKIIQTNIDTDINNVPTLLKSLENPKDADSLATGQRLVESSYNRTRESIVKILNETPGMDSVTYNNLIGMVDSAYQSYRNRTPNTIKAAGEIIQQRGNNARDRAYDHMPQVMDVVDLFGQAGAGVLVNQFWTNNSQKSADNLTQAQRDFDSYMSSASRVHNGTPPPTDPGNLKATTDLTRGIQSEVNEIVKNPDSIPDKGLPALGNSVSFLADKALESNDPDDYNAAVTTLNSAGTARALERLKTTNPDLYESTNQKIIQVNTQSILANARRARDAAVGSSAHLGDAEQGFMFWPGADTRSTAVIQYNAMTGAVEVSGMKPGATPNKDQIKTITSLNSSLRTLVRLKDHGNDQVKDMSDQDLKLALMTMSGIKIKGKTPEQQEVSESGTGNPTTASKMDIPRLTKTIAREESYVSKPYWDNKGYSVGYGHMIKPGEDIQTMDKATAEKFLQQDIQIAHDEIKDKPFFKAADTPARQEALVEMSYQLGLPSLLGFKNSLKMIEEGRWKEAGDNLRKSKWYQQTPKRAKRIIRMIETGEF